MITHKVASREEWLAARAALLEREKEHTRMGDELAQERRELPWVPVEKQYMLQTAGGPKTLAELFDGRSQLLIYHFMFGPSYEAGCPVNSSIADSFDGLIPHLKARDVTLDRRLRGADREAAGLSRADGVELRLGVELRERLQRRPRFLEQLRADAGGDRAGSRPAASRRVPQRQVAGTDIYGYMTELFGFTAFTLEDEIVYQTYSTTGRGVEFLMPYYGFLDRAPKGRDEGTEWQLWIRRHDEYDTD